MLLRSFTPQRVRKCEQTSSLCLLYDGCCFCGLWSVYYSIRSACNYCNCTERTHAVTHANAFGQIGLRMKARHNRKKPNHQTGQFDDNECIYNFILDTYVRNLTAPPIQPLTTMGADDSMPFSQIHCAFEFINILSLDLPANHLYLISYAIRISLLLSLLAKFKATIC